MTFLKLMCTMDETHSQFLYLIQLQADHSLGRRKAYFGYHLICCSSSPKTHLSGRSPLYSLHMKNLTFTAPSAHYSIGFVCRMTLPQTPQLHGGSSPSLRQEPKAADAQSSPAFSWGCSHLTTPRPESKETFSRLRGAHILHLQHVFQAMSERHASCWCSLLHEGGGTGKVIDSLEGKNFITRKVQLYQGIWGYVKVSLGL